MNRQQVRVVARQPADDDPVAIWRLDFAGAGRRQNEDFLSGLAGGKAADRFAIGRRPVAAPSPRSRTGGVPSVRRR